MRKITILKYVKYFAPLILMAIVLAACEDETIILPGDEQQNQIRVIGTANLVTSPDIAKVQIGVQTLNKELEPAINENNKKADAVIAALRQQGVAEKDIKTAYFSVYPQRDYQNSKPNEIIGYQVDNTISVVLRDLKSVGKALQATLDAGANNISGLTFTIEDPEPLRRDARLKAIQDARKQAEDIAAAAGIKLGNIITINDIASSVPGIYREYDKAAISESVPVQPGQLEMTVQVEIVYAIIS